MEQNVFLCISVLFWGGFRRTEKEMYLKWSLVLFFYVFLIFHLYSVIFFCYVLSTLSLAYTVFVFCLYLANQLTCLSVYLRPIFSSIFSSYIYPYIYSYIYLCIHLYFLYVFSPSYFYFSLYLYILLVYRFLLCIFLLIYLSLPSFLFF